MTDPHLVYSCIFAHVLSIDKHEVRVVDQWHQKHHLKPDDRFHPKVGDWVLIDYLDGEWHFVDENESEHGIHH